MSDAVNIYRCDVMHARHFPMQYRFTYRVYSLLLDIDQLDEATRNPLLSLNRFNLFSINYKDHGARDGSSWRAWADKLLDAEGLTQAKARIQLLTFPRILGYAFAPLSLWYCHDEQGRLHAIICEVSNTFGEHHHYLLHNHNQPLELPVKASKQKIFHVSPFINMQQQYRFTLDKPAETLRIVINEYEQGNLMLVATQSGERRPFTTPELLRCFFGMPLMTLKIITLIHWQALKIWRKGGKFHRKPPPPVKNLS